MRPHTLTAAVMPVLIGTSIAYSDGVFSLPLFAAMMAASLMIQAAVNMFNEYFDYKRGLDSVESVGIGGVIVRDELHEKTVLRTAVIFFSFAVILGVYICIRTSWWIAAVGSASMAVGYFYSAGKYPLAYTALGETAAGIFMGPVIVLISYFIQRDTITLPAVLLSVPISILVGAILLANNIRDSEGDAKKGRKTLAIIWGRERAIIFLNRLFMTSYIWTVGLVLFKVATPWTLLVFLGIPKATRSINLFRAGSTPSEMMPAMKATSQLHSQFGILFSIGTLLGKFLPIR
jgi:1,4-dihydroxy-2-naphthoate polyprenyltransferase